MKIHKPIHWIFFDVGGVLMDDTKNENKRVDLILEAVQGFRPEITKEKVSDIRRKASSMLGGLTENIVSLFLKDKKQVEECLSFIRKNWKSEIASPIRPNSIEVIKKLSQKYNLGLLANQPIKNREILKNAGILEYFKFQDVSENFNNLKKPNPEFFKAVFNATGASPEHSAIIDDNIERGLLPAKKFGMATIWFKLEERDVVKEVDFVIINPVELLEIFL